MIRGFQIKDHPFIEDAKFEDIGRMVVVCGKNNSGKTALLKELVKTDGGAHFWLHELSTEFITGLPKVLSVSNGWRVSGAQKNEEVIRAYNRIKEALSLRLWSNETVAYKKRVESILKISGFYSGELDMPFISYVERAVSAPSVLMIPTDRVLDFEVDLVGEVSVSARGDFLLVVLFKHSSQKGSEQYKVYEKIVSAFESITDGTRFNIEITNHNKIKLKICKASGEYIEGTSSGMGLRQLLVILYHVYSSKYDIIAIDEIESHLHPELIRRLMALISRDFNGIAYLSTHSNVVIGSTFCSNVLYCSHKGSKICVTDQSTKAHMLTQLGYSVSENLVSDLVVLVEGPGDVSAYSQLIARFPEFDSKVIKFWSMGGDAMAYIDLNVMHESHRLCAVIDKDPKSKSARDVLKKKCAELNVEVHQLKCYSVENCLPKQAIRRIFPKEMEAFPGNGYFDMSKKIICDDDSTKGQVNFNFKKRLAKIIQNMPMEEIESSPLLEVVNFLRRLIKESPGAVMVHG